MIRMIGQSWGRDHRGADSADESTSLSSIHPALDIIALGAGSDRGQADRPWPRAVGTTTRGKHPDREELMTGHPATPPRVRRTATTLADGRELISVSYTHL